MLSPGQIIDGKYRIERCLAEGGMGAVYLGQNTRIGRQVAIKVLHGVLAKQGVQVERFEQEAQLLARIGSQYIVEVLDMGDLPSGDSYMVMEYLEGESLGERLHRRKRLEPDEAVQIVEQALTGLEAAHGAGVVHRDIKPDNLFLQRRPEGELIKILDFGVSKLQLDTQDLRHSKLTLNGTLVGTPQYMSPEQARGHETDHHTDIFAMGIVLFECIAGETPFVGENMHDLLFKVALEEPRTLASLRPDVDPKLESIVRRATARSPDNRYA
ncbi:MAG: serine/threonine protein kinase, partial [Myxococcales bacterium]